MLVNREVILAGVESTYNTAVTLTGSNAILVEGPSWSHEGARMVERNNVKASLAKDQSVFAGTLKQVTFECELKGSGAAGTAPEIGPLLRACGLDETIVASTSVTYAPVSTGHESITLNYYSDGIRHVLTGCRGTVSFALEAGSFGKASFTFTGHEATPTDVSLVTPTYDSTVPPPLINVPFSIGGYLAVITNLAVDLTNGIATPASISAADGFGEILITSRDVAGSFNPEQVLVATKNYISEWKAGTTAALTTGVVGSSAGNRYTLSGPACYYRDIGAGDIDGKRAFEITCGFAESSGDDEISLAFT